MGAIRTLSKLVRDRAEISVLSRVNGDWIPVDEDCSSAAKLVEGRRWLELLNAVPDAPPSWIVDLVEKVGHPGLRIYPMLSPKPRSWSVRLEGLEVAKLTSAGGVLGVGKDSEKVAGKGSPQRRLWVEATGLPDGLRITVETDPAQTVDAIRAFAERWLPVSPVGKVEQNEHVLESRILRGAAPVQVGDTRLALIRESSRVNWGSQFPTLWGSHGKPRYLDALMRDGHVPWALEMKVQGGGGVSQYYRHGVAQTVLYREFIRAATPLHDWFTNRNAGLDPTCCQGAFVVPEVPVGQQKQLEWLRHAQVLCDLFDVRLATVPAVYAERRALSGDISA